MISLTQCLRAAAVFALVSAGLVSAASAQTAYPNRTITLVLPFAAGSGTDTTTRIISQHLGAALGVGMVIDNKPGANGMIAATYVARAAPDGYTLFVTTNTTHSANPFLLKTLTYDPVKDFTPIARTGDLPFMLVVNPDLPAKSVAELVAYGKTNPGKLTYASGSFLRNRLRRDIRAQRRHRHAARALQELAARAERCDRRAYLDDIH
jgi:tripartite-type tricarboxylate transporter receptor subunit TctC